MDRGAPWGILHIGKGGSAYGGCCSSLLLKTDKNIHFIRSLMIKLSDLTYLFTGRSVFYSLVSQQNSPTTFKLCFVYCFV